MTDAHRSSPGDRLTASLHDSGGTVTEFLEQLAGEPIEAEIVSQQTVLAGVGNLLGLVPDDELVRRAVFLRGRTTARNFVYAESVIAASRLPEPVRRRLELSRDPIGRVLLDHHIRICREPLGSPPDPEHLGSGIVDCLSGSVLSRRDLIAIDDVPIIVVSEWFLPAVLDGLDPGR